MSYSGDDERKSSGRRSDDRALDQWRGQISQQVDSHEDALRSINGDLRDVRDRLSKNNDRITDLGGQIKEARADIEEVIESLRQTRAQMHKSKDEEREEMREDLKDAMLQVATSRSDLFRYVGAPIVVAVIGGIILFLVTGHHP